MVDHSANFATTLHWTMNNQYSITRIDAEIVRLEQRSLHLVDPLTGVNTEEDVANVNAEIAFLKEGILRLRSTRNSLQPVGRLQADLLPRIFLLFEYNGSQENHSSRLLQLTWVSRYWRNVALESKGLWNCIDRSNWHWADALVKRSGDALLSVTLAGDAFHCGAYKILDSISWRLKYLNLTVSKTTDEDALLSTWRSACPQLEYLILTASRVPENLLLDPEHGLALRRLELTNCTFDYGKVLTTFSQVTTLVIQNPNERIPPRFLMQLLDGIPKLKSLTLRRVLDKEYTPLIHEDPLPTTPSASHLISLRLNDNRNTDSYLYFVEHFRLITTETSVFVKSHLSEYQAETFKDRITTFSNMDWNTSRNLVNIYLRHDTGRSPALGLQFDSNTTSSSSSSSSSNSTSSRNRLPAYRTCYTFRLTGIPDWIGLGLWAAAAAEALDLSHLHTLRVLAADLLASDARRLVSTFGPYPQIQHVNFECSITATSDFLESMGRPLSSDDSDAESQPELVPFPKLETYTVQLFDEHLDNLRLAFKFRNEKGCQLPKLVMLGKEFAVGGLGLVLSFDDDVLSGVGQEGDWVGDDEVGAANCDQLVPMVRG